MTEWRAEVLWRLDASSLDNDTFALVADAAEEHDWTASRWEDGAGFYITGYVDAATPAEAGLTQQDYVGKWIEGISLPGHLASVEVLPLDIAEMRAEKPTVPELASAADAADILGISRQRVHQLSTSNARFPQPVTRVATGPLWTRASIEWFASVWERQPGRPAKPAQTRTQPATPSSTVTPIRAAAGYTRRATTQKASESKPARYSIAAKRTK